MCFYSNTKKRWRKLLLEIVVCLWVMNWCRWHYSSLMSVFRLLDASKVRCFVLVFRQQRWSKRGITEWSFQQTLVYYITYRCIRICFLFIVAFSYHIHHNYNLEIFFWCSQSWSHCQTRVKKENNVFVLNALCVKGRVNTKGRGAG